MTDLPKYVDIHEEGPREGFQIEAGPISTADGERGQPLQGVPQQCQ
jgi:hydroxymethylglutaryl-CoA lyase